MEDVEKRCIEIIAASKNIPPSSITLDSTFEELAIDSMDAVEVLFALEGEFDINIPDEEVRSVRGIRQMCEGVERLLLVKSGAVLKASE